eukprot:s2204_g4.t3
MEREIRDAMDPQVSDAVKGKKLALFKEMLEFHKYLDLGVISELLDGADLTGDVPKTDMLPFKFIPALLTEESLMNQSKLRRPLVGRDCRGSGDDEVDESVWKQILEECQLGRMQFAESQIYGRIGRRCTKALREAAGRRRAKPLDREKLFLRLFANLLNAGKRRILSWDNTPSVVIFTDACYERNARDWICGLGAVMIDTLTGEKWVFSLHVDERQRAILGEANEKQIIFEAETFCAVLAYSFWMKSLDRRRSFLYVDNEGTKFCLMKGSSENAGVDLLCPEFAELCIQPRRPVALAVRAKEVLHFWPRDLFVAHLKISSNGLQNADRGSSRRRSSPLWRCHLRHVCRIQRQSARHSAFIERGSCAGSQRFAFDRLSTHRHRGSMRDGSAGTQGSDRVQASGDFDCLRE